VPAAWVPVTWVLVHRPPATGPLLRQCVAGQLRATGHQVADAREQSWQVADLRATT